MHCNDRILDSNNVKCILSYNYSVRNVDKLISDLLPIINTPKRHILFDEVGYVRACMKVI